MICLAVLTLYRNVADTDGRTEIIRQHITAQFKASRW